MRETKIKKDSKIEYIFFFLKARNDTREHDDKLRATQREARLGEDLEKEKDARRRRWEAQGIGDEKPRSRRSPAR